MSLISQSFKWIQNPDGSLDGSYPNGNKVPTSELTWDNTTLATTLDVIGIDAIETGTPFSHNVRQYLSGTDAGTATLTLIVVSGDDPTTNGWTAPGSGNNIVYDAVNERSGTFRIRATGSAGSVDSASIIWSCTTAVEELSWNNNNLTNSLSAAGINIMTTSTPFSHNVRQYLNGTEASTATITFVNVSGDNPTTNGWTAPGSGNNIAYDGVNARSGVFQLRATGTSGNVDSISVAWSCTVAEIELSWNNTTMNTNLINAGIQVMQTGTPFSHNVRQYLSGTDAGTASLSFVNVSGDNPTTNGWTAPGLGNNIAYNAVNARSGSFRLRATSSPEVVDSSVINWACTSGPPPPGPADYIIPKNDTGTNSYASRTIDATSLGLGAGSVIEFQAGGHGPLTLSRFIGTANNPIIIRAPQSGQAIIRRKSPQSGGFVCILDRCRHIIIDGFTSSGTVDIGPDGKRHGIKIMYALNATSGNKDVASQFVKFKGTETGTNGQYNNTRDITIRYLELDGGWSGNDNTGPGASVIAFASNDHKIKLVNFPNSWQENIILEHNYVHDFRGEGTYIGPNPYLSDNQPHGSEGVGRDVPLRYVKIRYNYIKNIGGNGVSVKSVFGGVNGFDGPGENSIHHNVVLQCGFDPNANGTPAISLNSSNCNVYNNWVENCGESGIVAFTSDGTATGEPSLTFTHQVFNNVVRNGTKDGIGFRGNYVPASMKTKAFVFNNSVTGFTDRGISIDGSCNPSSWARNNVSVSNGNNIAIGAGSKTSNLETGTAANIFVDSAGTYENQNINMRLQNPSLSSGTKGTDIAEFDYEDENRTGSTHKGAYHD